MGLYQKVKVYFFPEPEFKGIYKLEDYLNLPKEKRENWWGWYHEPNGYTYHFWDVNTDTASFESFFANEYPIQYFLREQVQGFFSSQRYRWRDRWYRFKCIFNPQQKWLTKHIPRSWCDKTELIPTLLFASVVHFIEEEADTIDWHSDPHHQQAMATLKQCYRYAKLRDRLESKQWSDTCMRSWYVKLHSNCEKHYMKKIVEVHDYMWS